MVNTKESSHGGFENRGGGVGFPLSDTALSNF